MFRSSFAWRLVGGSLPLLLVAFSVVPASGQEMTEEEWQNRMVGRSQTFVADFKKVYPVGDWDKENPGQEFRTKTSHEGRSPIALANLIEGKLWDGAIVKRISTERTTLPNGKVREAKVAYLYQPPNYGDWHHEVELEMVWVDHLKNSDDGKEYSGWLVNNLYTDKSTKVGLKVRGPRYFIPNRTESKRTSREVLIHMQMFGYHPKDSRYPTRGRVITPPTKKKAPVQKEARKGTIKKGSNGKASIQKR
ncbi:MAG: hypothetical protein MPJ24_08610 [Pirellulaceae bacterium]|nr:hypothetical protein [Pirellulaceae bacterium]